MKRRDSQEPATRRRWFARWTELVAVAALALALAVIPAAIVFGHILLAVAGAKSPLVRERLVAPGAPRWTALFAAVTLAVASFLVLRVIIPRDASDNAWLVVAIPGLWLAAMAAAGLVVAALPGSLRAAGLGAVSFSLLVYGGAQVALFAVGALFVEEKDLDGLDFRSPVRQAFAVFLAVWLANVGLHAWLARCANNDRQLSGVR